MKVGFVLDESLDGTDGVQQYLQAVGVWLTEHGHEVYYLVGQTSRTDMANIQSLSRNVKVRFNGNRLSIPLPTAGSKLQAVLDDLSLDILHVQAPYSPFLAGKLIHRVADTTAVVGTFHILPFGALARAGSAVLGKMNTKTAQRFDAMMSASQPAQAFAAEYFGFRSVVIPNPISTQRYLQARSAERTVNIVYLGRLVERKGPLWLLKAVAYMLEHKLYEGDFRLKIGGKGPLLPAMQKFLEQSGWGLIRHTELVGFVSEEHKPVFLASADIAAFPSAGGESFGISVVEALAASRGVVLAGDNPGYRSVMQGFESQLIDPTNTKAFAEKLAKHLRETSDRKQIASAQKTHVKQYDIATVGPKIEQIYEQALQKRRAS